MKKIFQIAVFVYFAFCSNGYAKLLDAQSFVLDNGLEVIVIPNHKAPIVMQMVWYKAGSMDEKPGKGGVAHLLEHLMFRGTKKVPGSSFNDIVAENGGESNAFTSHDFTAYHEFVDISRLETAMALEADRMANLDINPEAFAGERKIVFQERQQRVSNLPTAQFAENLERTLWQDQPYARPVTGTEAEIKGLKRQDAVDFYRCFYAPQNAILVLSGDIDTPTAKILAEKYFGAIKGHNNANEEGCRAQSIPLGKNQQRFRQESEAADIQTVRIMRKFIVPSLKMDTRKAYALMVFAKYFGEGDNSFLNRELVLKGKMAAAGAYYDNLTRKEGTFTIFAIPQAGMDEENAEKLLNGSIEMSLKALTPEKLEKEKNKMLSGLVYIRDNPQNAAMLAGQMAALGFSLQEIENYEDNIRAVKLEEIQKAVSEMLGQANSVTGILKPQRKQTPLEKNELSLGKDFTNNTTKTPIEGK